MQLLFLIDVEKTLFAFNIVHAKILLNLLQLPAWLLNSSSAKYSTHNSIFQEKVGLSRNEGKLLIPETNKQTNIQ